MGESQFVKVAIKAKNLGVDPGFCTVSTALNDCRKFGICSNGIGCMSNMAGETAGNMEIVQREDAAFARVYPMDRWIIATFGHWGNARGIGP